MDRYEQRKLRVREHGFNDRFVQGRSSIDGAKVRQLPPVPRELSSTPPPKASRKQQTALANRLIGLDNDPTASNAFMVDTRTVAGIPLPAHGYRGWTLFDMRNVRNAGQILAERQLTAIQALGQELDDLTIGSLGESLPPPPPKKQQAAQDAMMRRMALGKASTSTDKLRHTVVGQTVDLGQLGDGRDQLASTWGPGAEFSLLPGARGADLTFLDSTNTSSLRFTSSQGPRLPAFPHEATAPRATVTAKSQGANIMFNTTRRMKRRRKRALELFRGPNASASRPGLR